MTSRIVKQRGATLAACLMALAASAAPPVSAQSNAPHMRLRVLDAETGQPVTKVKVRAWVQVKPTDESGLCLIPRPQSWPQTLGCRIILSKSGYVGQYITWSEAQHDQVHDIPAEFTARLEKGVSLGGIVKNEKGEPVSGALVILSGPASADVAARVQNVMGAEFDVERTDAAGQWRFDKAPQALQSVRFHVAHSQYAPADFSCQEDPSEGESPNLLSKEDLLAGRAVMTLGHGIALSVRVTDAAGRPVAGAAITRNHAWRDPATSLSTDAHGEFRVSNLLSGELCLTIQADALAAQTCRLALSNRMPELNIEMKPGNVFQGRIVGPGGKPIPGAGAQLDRLGQRPLEFDWTASTDGQGRFSWNAAPAGAHPYFFSAPGYHPRREPALLADGSDHLISLRPKAKGDKTWIDGQVVDAASKAPMTHFTVSVKQINGREVSRFQQSFTNAVGLYRVAVNTDAAAYVISIETPGFRVATSRPRSPGDGDLRLDFALEKGTGASDLPY